MAAAEGSGAGLGGFGRAPTVTLVSSDGQRFEVPEPAALLSGLLRRRMVEDVLGLGKNVAAAGAIGVAGVGGRSRGVIPLPSVSGKPLAKIVEYCGKHAAAGRAAVFAADKAVLREWDEAFIRRDDIGQAMLHDILIAADELELDGLVDLACWRLADMVKGRSPDEIRALLGIVNDFKPKKRNQIHRDNPWL